MATAGKASKTYGQFCGLARSLDMVGDRWTLLIVRELLVGPRRFGELLAGLPGVATNLLTERLRQLERDEVITRQLGAEPDSGIRYTLTPRGAELREVIEALVRWSTPLMAVGRRDDVFRPGWLAVALPALLRARPKRPVRLGIETSGETFALELSATGVSATQRTSEHVDAVLRAEPEIVLALASGAITVQQAQRRGLHVAGDRAKVTRLFRA